MAEWISNERSELRRTLSDWTISERRRRSYGWSKSWTPNCGRRTLNGWNGARSRSITIIVCVTFQWFWISWFTWYYQKVVQFNQKQFTTSAGSNNLRPNWKIQELQFQKLKICCKAEKCTIGGTKLILLQELLLCPKNGHVKPVFCLTLVYFKVLVLFWTDEAGEFFMYYLCQFSLRKHPLIVYF